MTLTRLEGLADEPVPDVNETDSPLERDMRVIRLCLVALTVVAFLTIGVAAADLLAPTAVAVVLALVLAPMCAALERFGVPSGAAALVVVVATVSVLVFGGLKFAPSASDLIKRAPAIVQSVENKLQPLRRQIAAVENASQQINRSTAPQPPNGRVVMPVVDNGMLVSVATTAPGVLAKIVYVTVLTIFLLATRRQYTNQLILMPRQLANRVRMARIARDVQSRVSGYLFTMAMINVGLAVTTAIAFGIAGIPQGWLWGIAYGCLNFVPIIGPTTIILAAALVGFATQSTFFGAILPPAILLIIDTIEAYLVQPWLLSRRIVVSPVAIFVMVATLVWMWGPAAGIVAVPALILVHAVAMHVPSMRPFALLLATETTPYRIKRR